MTETKRQRLMEEAVDALPIPPELEAELPYECQACKSVMRRSARAFHSKRCKGNSHE